MAASSARLTVLAMTALALLLLLCLGPGGVSGNKLKLMLQKQEAPASPKTKVAVDENKAKEFLNSLKRQKRQLWDRTRPEVQQWYQQFLYMGFDEANQKFEDDVTYWLNRGRNGDDYYDSYQRHYDEDSAMSPYDSRAIGNYHDY
ncbi:augurin [Prionailurus iriomotensis]